MKIYVTSVEALRKKGKRGSKPDETQFGMKNVTNIIDPCCM
jgi:hypothetical protein